MSTAKSIYVASMRTAERVAERTGFLRWLDRKCHLRTARWARSLFAIYDIEAMIKLDLPWWTFDAIDKVDAFLAKRPTARVFEYGSGASTVWLGKRAAEVTSVEHDAGWFPVVQSRLATLPHVRHILVPPDPVRDPDLRWGSTKAGWRDRTFRNYVRAIDSEPGMFDVIIIDGRARAACLDHAAGRLAPDGLIVFDNSRRAPYVSAISRSGLSWKTYAGLTACLPYPDATTLLTH